MSIGNSALPNTAEHELKQRGKTKSEFPDLSGSLGSVKGTADDDVLPRVEPVEKKSLSMGQKLHKALSCFLDRLPGLGIDGEMDAKKFEEVLRVGAFNVVQLIIPVSLCMAVVVTFQLVIAVKVQVTSTVVITGVLADTITEDDDSFLTGLITALVFITLILLSTVLLILLFKYHCNKAIFVWLMVSSALLVFVATSTYFMEILDARNIVADWPSFALFVWNYGSLGILVIHWKGPLRVQQGYLIINSAVVAIILLKFLPSWSTWLILALLSIYDIIAVLCPKGPLRILIDLAKERGELNLPSLIYSSTMVWTVTMADVNKKAKEKKSRDNNSSFSSSSKIVPQSCTVDEEERKVADNCEEEMTGNPRKDIAKSKKESVKNKDNIASKHEPTQNSDSESDEEEEVKRGFKIGLGDLVFYSVLVGKAASISNGNWVIILSCFVAILMGLCLTSLILGIVHRALPALPISIFFGLAFYFSSQHIIAPFVEVLNVNQIYI